MRTERVLDPWTLDYVARDQEQVIIVQLGPQRPAIDGDWFRHFHYDQYDFEDPAWQRSVRRGKKAWRLVRLYERRKGSMKRADVVPSEYFMAVSPCDYKQMTQFPDGSPKRWTLKIDMDPLDPTRIKKIYARRSGRGEEPRTVYAHRELMGILYEKHAYVADHFNGWGLDNRRQNLSKVKYDENGHNQMPNRRKKHLGLLRGVEMIKRGGEIRYRGIRARRLSKTKVLTIRSKRVWKTQEPAHQWYENEMKRLHGNRPWARHPDRGNYPLLPPKLESEISGRSSRLRSETRVCTATLEGIPF